MSPEDHQKEKLRTYLESEGVKFTDELWHALLYDSLRQLARMIEANKETEDDT